MHLKVNLISVSQIIEFVISFLIANVLLTHYTVDDYGIWSHFIRTASILIVILSFEINTNFLYRQSGKSNISSTSNLILLIFFYFFLFLVLMILTIPFENIIIKNLFNFKIFDGFIIFLLYYIFTNIYYQLFESYFLIKDKYLIVSFSVIIKQIIKIALIIFFIDEIDITKLILNYIIIDSILTIFCFILILLTSKFKLRFTKQRLKHFFKVNSSQSKYIFIGSCITSLFLFIDNYYIVKELNYEVIAKYSLFLGINSILVIIISMAGKIFLPELSRYFNGNKIGEYVNTINKSILFIFFWMLPMTIGINIIGQNLILIISSSKIKYEFITFILFSAFQLQFNIILFLRNLINIENKTIFYIKCILFGLIINIFLIFFFKPSEISTIIFFKTISAFIILITMSIKLRKRFLFEKIYYLKLFMNVLIMLTLFIVLYKFDIFNKYNYSIQIILKISIFSLIYILIDLNYGTKSILKKFYFKNLNLNILKIFLMNSLSRFNNLFINKDKFKVINIDLNKNNIFEIFKRESEKYRIEHVNIIKKKSPRIFLDFGCGIALTFFMYYENNKDIDRVYFIDKNINIFKVSILNSLKNKGENVDTYFFDNLNRDLPKVDFIFVDAVFMYINSTATREILKKFFLLEPKTILIHEFSYDTLITKVSGFLLDDKKIKSFNKIIKVYAELYGYKITRTKSSKNEKNYKKFGYNFLLEKIDD